MTRENAIASLIESSDLFAHGLCVVKATEGWIDTADPVFTAVQLDNAANRARRLIKRAYGMPLYGSDNA